MMNSSTFMIKSKKTGMLDAVLDMPGAIRPVPGVVLCHPHPLYGGNMNNNVIRAVSRELCNAGIAALCFNFRGVGGSSGNYSGGEGEKEDALAALECLAEMEGVDRMRIGLAGYSFGGMVALSLMDDLEPAAAVAVVSPIMPQGVLRRCTKPKLIICGDSDGVISLQDITREAEKMAEPWVIKVIQGADHFWWGCEDDAAGEVASFFANRLGAAKDVRLHGAAGKEAQNGII